MGFQKENQCGWLNRAVQSLTGCTEKKALDYDESFSPVVRFESFHNIVAVAVQIQLKLHQLDIIAAFLNGHFEEKIFMKQPEGFIEEEREAD